MISAAEGGSAQLLPENCFSPLAGLEAVSGGGPCPAEPARNLSNLDRYPQVEWGRDGPLVRVQWSTRPNC